MLRLLALLPLLLASPLSAHDLWLLPPERAAEKETLSVNVASGTTFPKSEQAPRAAFARQFALAPDGTTSDLTRGKEVEPYAVLSLTPKLPGVHVLAVETSPKRLSMTAEAFNAYLVEDGLPHIYKLRAREKTLDRPAREQYRKSPKVIVQVGDSTAGDPCKALGLPLEIVPLRNPLSLKVGETLGVRVLFKGKPLAGANLGWATPEGDEASDGTVRTNARGEALVPVARSGLMSIRLTHMTRPRAEEYEWESFWTTLTFRVPGGK